MEIRRNTIWKHIWNKITTRITDKENIYEQFYSISFQYLLFAAQRDAYWSLIKLHKNNGTSYAYFKNLKK